MTEEDKLYAEKLRNKALADYERLDHAINELERETCDTPRNNLAESSQDCISREATIDVVRKWFDKIQLNGDICLDGIISLPSVTPSYNSIKTELKPCEDCISRETAIDQFIHWYSELLLSQKEEASFEDILKSLPSVLPQHKKGKWIRYDVDIAFHPLHCSICGWSNHHIINKSIEEFQFCPNCGADMRESDKE